MKLHDIPSSFNLERLSDRRAKLVAKKLKPDTLVIPEKYKLALDVMQEFQWFREMIAEINTNDTILGMVIEYKDQRCWTIQSCTEGYTKHGAKYINVVPTKTVAHSYVQGSTISYLKMKIRVLIMKFRGKIK